MNYSFWEKVFIESPTQVTIIGSGIVGLSTAISIKESSPHLTVKVIERGAYPYGASTKNAGFSCFGSVSELLDDIDTMGESKCMEVVKMRFEGLSKLKNRVGLKNLVYQNVGGTELFRKKDEEVSENCMEQLPYCNSLMKDYLDIDHCYKIQDNQGFQNFKNKSIFNAHEGCINPVSMMNTLINQAISLGVQIVNGIQIVEIDQDNKILKTSLNLKIGYDKLIVCTNGFSKSLLPALDIIPARNQVLVTEPINNLKLPSCYHVDKGYIYFRETHGRLLLGGGRNISPSEEKTSEYGNTNIIQEYLLAFLVELFPTQNLKVEHWWSGILGISDSKYPICEWVSDDILVGVRLGGMGVAIGSYLGHVLSDKILQTY